VGEADLVPAIISPRFRVYVNADLVGVERAPRRK
jgi:hypothetical protein